LDRKKIVSQSAGLEKGVFEGMINSHIFVPIISRYAINHADNVRQNFSKLKSDSWDTLLFSFWMALELESRGIIQLIFPILIDEIESNGDVRPFCYRSSYPMFNDSIVIDKVGQKVSRLLNDAGLGRSRMANFPVKLILEAIVSRPGHSLKGNLEQELKLTVNELCAARDLIRNLSKRTSQWRSLVSLVMLKCMIMLTQHIVLKI
jgi:hypothetical protein